MKKTLLWGAIVSLFFVSCSKNEMVESIEPSCDFVAQLADVSRTELDGTAVIWNAEDELTIFTKTMHNRHYKVKTLSEDGRTATFGFVDYTGTSNGTISANYAVYPYDAQATLNGDVISTTIASEQQYNAEKVDLSCALMAAKSETTSFAFVNAGALMRFNVSKSELIPDSYTLNSIKLSSAANNIAGDVTIDLSAESRAVVASTGTKEITLTAINQEITNETKSFYVALPAVNFADKDLTVTFTFTDGEKSFALPAFELEQGSIKTIAYTINDSEDFTGTTPGEAPKPANNEIFYTNGSTTEATTPNNTSVFGANIVSNTYDTEKECWVIKFDGEVTKIGDRAFYNCSKLTSVTIGNSVTSIGNSAFRDCTSLINVTIDNELISVDIFAFLNCISLKAFYGKPASIDNRCLIIDGVLNSFAPAGLIEYLIPNNITSIGGSAFRQCSSLKRVTIGNSVTSIGSYAFSECNSLMDVTIPDSVTTIEFNAFRDCTSLTSVTIGNGVTSMDDGLFYGCSSLKAFYGKFASEDNRCIIVNGKLLRFAPAGLTEYTIPDSVISIGERPFQHCSDLCSIVIPNSVTSIGNLAFSGCSSLTSVYCKSTTPPAMGDIYDPLPFNSRMKIYVPHNSYDAYKLASGWSRYADYIVGYDF